jgi:hypothetical protein
MIIELGEVAEATRNTMIGVGIDHLWEFSA